jgi:hypothetical protein
MQSRVFKWSESERTLSDSSVVERGPWLRIKEAVAELFERDPSEIMALEDQNGTALTMDTLRHETRVNVHFVSGETVRSYLLESKPFLLQTKDPSVIEAVLKMVDGKPDPTVPQSVRGGVSASLSTRWKIRDAEGIKVEQYALVNGRLRLKLVGTPLEAQSRSPFSSMESEMWQKYHQKLESRVEEMEFKLLKSGYVYIDVRRDAIVMLKDAVKHMSSD